ncbi:leucine-rich repeat and immunoglobulin-like domain-containing nogo receptor-interacting protein 1 [Scyliorhinus canicula]|uniref:leucine-rich repeat and immunoglobulin-like domain-containing nogo receptor-interacting protein 1 n=1 Tax=Scyliorhinus canicula TaxID=7830 RepID=UPI0018F60C5A|nr:leucine-rich repeat and immunoglobulin-like domain-containing nogo receptor-interacting protein 1 [Scyliorhinus canicula]XP_038643628.1 leucine-rich repeat and immunoglobulin-like domain-containing nogo receptor-interacting protein 1 [Scyliorhinus canicula]XP_038644579.1 leucine-rich repeat and immunoglobulin-like domain-containing nogo receptor-interacting protein 1 [Scyliorhinus canicula]XP_038644580.1 leucine-rich repeat and immunoglobulin-like domain-containing nogo receptor-interacting p
MKLMRPGGRTLLPAVWPPLLPLLLLLGPGLGCPSDCLCWSPNRTVSCSSRGLDALPRGIPAGTRVLDLSGNRLERLDWGPARGLSHRLEELELGHNRLRELEAGALGGLERLWRLGLGHNLLRYLQPGALRGLAALRSLELAGNPLLLLSDHTFRGLAALRTLSLGSPELAWAGPRAWAGLSGLNQLTVRGAALAWPPGPVLSPLLNLTALRLLAFPKGTALPGRPFQGLSRLRLLEIDSWASLAQLGPDCLLGLNLVWLSVTRCNLSDVPYASLRTQAYLRFLNLSHNPITAIRGALLQHVTRLEELRLVGGRLRVIHDAAFRGLIYFRLLDVTANQLASLPANAFRSLASLQSLGLGLNPLACDCRLLWIVRRRHRLRFLGSQPPACASPPPLRGRRLPEAAGSLPASTFSCRRPRIRDKRPQRLQAREGQTVTLHCSADGQPLPLILWLNPRRQRLGHPEAGMGLPGGLGLIAEDQGLKPEDRGLLPGRPDPSLPPAPPLLSGPAVGRSRLLPNGSLQITSVRRMDSGTYRCVARNAGGNATASASLQVRPLSLQELGLAGRSDSRAKAGLRPGYPFDTHTLLVATTMGFTSFFTVVSLCFTLLFIWSRVSGPIKHNIHVDFVPHAGGGGGGSSGDDAKYNMKMV